MDMVVTPCTTWTVLLRTSGAGPTVHTLLPFGRTAISIHFFTFATASLSWGFGVFLCMQKLNCQPELRQLLYPDFRVKPFCCLPLFQDFLLSFLGTLPLLPELCPLTPQVSEAVPCLVQDLRLLSGKKLQLQNSHPLQFLFFKNRLRSISSACFLLLSKVKYCTYTQNKNECHEQTRNVKDFLEDSVLARIGGKIKQRKPKKECRREIQQRRESFQGKAAQFIKTI